MTITPEPLWTLEKAALVHAPGVNLSCPARLRITHDSDSEQGSISIHIKLALAGFSGNGKQTLMLSISPELVDMCTVVSKSNDRLIPHHMLSTVPVSVTNSAAVSTMVLCLNAHGVVIAPHATSDILSPANPDDINFRAFAKLCQTKTIHVHFSKQQFNHDELSRLRTFAGTLCAHLLKARPYDRKRLNAGRGAVETDWRVFEQPDPPPYRPDLPPYHGTVLGKRSRGECLLVRAAFDVITWCSHVVDAGELSTTHWLQTKLYTDNSIKSPSIKARSKQGTTPSPPPWSPTEINTPTTCSSSEWHISPTNFTREVIPDRADRVRVLQMQRQLRNLPDEHVREILRGSGHQHLLTTPNDVKPLDPSVDADAGAEPVSVSKVDQMIERRLDELVEKRLEPLMKDAFQSLTQKRLGTLVKAQLPVAADLFLNAAVTDYRDQFHEECQMNEVSVREQIDEGNTEVREVTDGCAKEISELAQRYMDDMAEQRDKLDLYAEEELSRLKCWFAELAESFFGRGKVLEPQVTSVKRRGSF
jgi:hypothetical protein